MKPLTEKPPRGNAHWHWRSCYFSVGDAIEWICTRTNKRRFGTLAHVKKNPMGRISYISNKGDLIFIEHVAKAAHKPRPCGP